MKVEYRSNRIATVCTDYDKAFRKLGKKGAEALLSRINQLESAESLRDIEKLRGPRLHWLQGDHAGWLAVDLEGGMRLIFEPSDHVKRDYSEIDEIRIIMCEDYHK